MACETYISITQEVFSTSGNATAHSVLPISDGGLKCFLNYIYVSEHTAEAEALLMEPGKIPAPSRHEDRRAEFCRDWLLLQGAEDVEIDQAKNVICRINCDDQNDLTAFMAHTDIVFPDEDTLPMTLDGRKPRAPGIGDDTANLVNLLMSAKYILEHAPELHTGFLIVANSCEECLGNLDGTKEIFRVYGDRIKGFYSFDCYLSQCTSIAVGSYRYKITARTTGGHSWQKFGQPNAIQILCTLVDRLYQLEVPKNPRTTYSVGYFNGGTTVNAIAQEASMLFEFRSISQKCLEDMDKKLREIVAEFQGNYEIVVELLGIRPGNGDVNPDALARFTDLSTRIIQEFYDGEVDLEANSTDANIPLSKGVCANTIGTISGAGAHTREEWVDLDSLPTGMKIVLSLMLHYTVLSE